MVSSLLSRRFVRRQAMLHYYAFLICSQANYQCTLKETSQHVAYDPFDPSLEGKQERGHEIQQCTAFFEALRSAKPVPVHAHKSISRVGHLLYKRYQDELVHDTNVFKDGFYASVEKINQFSVRIWQLLLAWTQLAREDATAATYLTQSILLVHLKQALSAVDYTPKEKPLGAIQTHLVHEWYHQWVKNHALWQTNVAASYTLEQEAQFVTKLVRKVIFKSPLIERFFMQEDPYWALYKPIVKQLVLQGITYCAQNSVSDRKFSLSLIQHDDTAQHFYSVLVDTTLQHEVHLEATITEYAKHWAYDRLLVLDQAILKLALCELYYFPDIPFKVSINEYIALAKAYGTPKSAPFINGILDAAAKASPGT